MSQPATSPAPRRSTSRVSPIASVSSAPSTPDTLASRNNLASVYDSAGDLARATPLYEQAVAR